MTTEELNNIEILLDNFAPSELLNSTDDINELNTRLSFVNNLYSFLNDNCEEQKEIIDEFVALLSNKEIYLTDLYSVFSNIPIKLDNFSDFVLSYTDIYTKNYNSFLNEFYKEVVNNNKAIGDVLRTKFYLSHAVFEYNKTLQHGTSHIKYKRELSYTQDGNYFINSALATAEFCRLSEEYINANINDFRQSFINYQLRDYSTALMLNLGKNYTLLEDHYDALLFFINSVIIEDGMFGEQDSVDKLREDINKFSVLNLTSEFTNSCINNLANYCFKKYTEDIQSFVNRNKEFNFKDIIRNYSVLPMKDINSSNFRNELFIIFLLNNLQDENSQYLVNIEEIFENMKDYINEIKRLKKIVDDYKNYVIKGNSAFYLDD